MLASAPVKVPVTLLANTGLPRLGDCMSNWVAAMVFPYPSVQGIYTKYYLLRLKSTVGGNPY
jgi:hypothetical protein